MKNRELETIVIIGDKSKSIPGSGQYLNRITLEKLNQPNINQVLRHIPGINIRDEEGFGLRPNIGLRGTQVNRSAKITLMEDGLLIAPAPYADPSAYYFPTFARMAGLEVLKGSSQIKYGPYTIGGAINLLSTFIPNAFEGFAQVSYGRFGTNHQRFWVGDARKHFDYVFEINRIASNGFKRLDNGGNTGFERRDLMGKLRWHTDEQAKIFQSVTLKFVNSNEDGNESYLGLTYNDFKVNPVRRYAATQKDQLEMFHHHISLSHLIMPAKGLKIHSTAYYSNTFRDWARVNAIAGQSLNNILQNPTTYATAYQVMTGNTNGNIDFQSAARTYFSKGIQTDLNYLFNTRALTHKIQLGTRYHIDQADRFSTRSVYAMTKGVMILTSAGIRGNQENQIRNSRSLASFLQYDMQINRLKVSTGIRYEHIRFDFQNYGNADNARLGNFLRAAENQLSILLPGIGFTYRINENMNMLSGIHRGFSPPGMPSVSSTSNQAKMETSINYELGYQFEKNAINTKIVGFLNQYDNILGSDNISGGGAGTGDQFNAGNATVGGIEFSVAFDILQPFRRASKRIKIPISISYTYSDARFKETFSNAGGDWGTGIIYKGDFIPFITPHQVMAGISAETKKFVVALTGQYTGKTRIKPGQGTFIFPAIDRNEKDVNALNHFLILDVSANYHLNKSFVLFTLINNLGNSKATIANLPQGYRPNIPISFSTGLKMRF
jgi:Fe(3+) dicitrate transport protein